MLMDKEIANEIKIESIHKFHKLLVKFSIFLMILSKLKKFKKRNAEKFIIILSIN